MAYNKNLYTSSTDALDAGIIYDTNITKMQSEINAMLNKYMVIIGEATFDEEAVDPQTSQTTQYYDFSPESGSSDTINLVDGDVVLIKFPQAHPFLTTNHNRIWILTNAGYTSYLVSSGDVVADRAYQTHFAFKFNGTFLIPFDINGAQEHYNELKTSLNTKFNKTGVARLVGKKIAIYGDSWATATYGSLGKAYIESITGETVHVVGSGSKTMAQIYTNCWDSYNADIYIIEGGLNDASLGTGATAFTSAIDTWLSAIRTVNANAEIYFVTPPAIKEANQSTVYTFPLEFYRIGIWSCAPFKNYGVINGLKWFDVALRSDNVHPTSDSVDKIGKHIINALANYGDEETHTTEVSYLGRNDTYFRIDCIGGTIYLVVFNLTANATSANTYTVTLGTLDTVFSTSSIAFINQKTGGAGDITYKSNSPNALSFYCYGTASGTQIITLVIKMPVEVAAWVNPYI